MSSSDPAPDRRGPIALAAVLALGLATAGGVLWWRTRSDPERGAASAGGSAERTPPAARAAAPPALVDGAAERTRRMSRQPAALPTHERGAKVYADAVAAGEKNPGEKAFRADALAFFDHNAELAEEKATKEGITTDELKELTVLGLVAMHIRRWDAVERLTQRELTADERARGDELVFSASKDLKAAIREHVAKGDSPEARWETIKKLETSFIDKYKALVRISADDYDRLLAQPFVPAGG